MSATHETRAASQQRAVVAGAGVVSVPTPAATAEIPAGGFLPTTAAAFPAGDEHGAAATCAGGGDTLPAAFSGWDHVIVIPGEPKGKARARVTRQGHAYTPAATKSAEAWVRQCIMEQARWPRIEGPLRVEITAVQPIPYSWSRKKRAAAEAGELLPTGRPDWDNVAKLVCDAANHLLWVDDAQIVQASIAKVYGRDPQVILRVARLRNAFSARRAVGNGATLPAEGTNS